MFNYQFIESGCPLKEADKALIALHGRGATAQNILEIASVITNEQFYIAAPQSPNNSWYPFSFMVEEKLNEPALSLSIENVRDLIEKVSLVIPKDRIYIFGFSQGACLALEVAAQYATKYGGIIAFTGGLIGEKINKAKYKGDFSETQIFIGAGDHDPHVPLKRILESKELLEALGAMVTLKVYPGMPHTIDQDEINWAKKILLN